jgi:hypothetical protein
MDALEIGMRVVANADAVCDSPIQTGREQNVGAGEAVAHEELSAVRKRDLDVTELLAKVFAGLGDDIWRNAIDRAERVRPMPAHYVEAGRIQFGYDEEAPLQPGCIFARRFRNQRALRRRIQSREVCDDCGTLANAEVAILEQRDLLARIEFRVFRSLGLTGPRSDRLDLVGQGQLVHGPVRNESCGSSQLPIASGPVLRSSHHVSTAGRRSSSWVQPSRVC